MTAIHLYDEEQDLDIEVVPGGKITLNVDLEATSDSGGLITISPTLAEEMVQTWLTAREP